MWSPFCAKLSIPWSAFPKHWRFNALYFFFGIFVSAFFCELYYGHQHGWGASAAAAHFPPRGLASGPAGAALAGVENYVKTATAPFLHNHYGLASGFLAATFILLSAECVLYVGVPFSAEV